MVRSGRGRFAWRTAFAIALVGFVNAAVLSPWFRHEVEVSVARQPTPFTELYVNDHTALPSHVPPGASATFRFTIANHEGSDLAYPYTVTISGATGTAEVQQGTVLVRDAGSSGVDVAFTPAAGVGASEVKVQLVGRTESLHFEVQS